jgi:FkbM family methyltransferase
MVVLDVGSFNGDDGLAWYTKGYNVIAFEPKRDLYESLAAKMQHLATRTPYFHVVNKAVSLTDGEVDFHLCAAGGASSILPFKSDPELDKHWTPRRTDMRYSGVSYKVSSTRLDPFLEEAGLANEPIEYLHVDAQGVDLDVLKSLGRYIANVQAGVVETCYQLDKAIYATQTDDVQGVWKWLTEQGFTVDRIQPNDDTKCECNVYFRK